MRQGLQAQKLAASDLDLPALRAARGPSGQAIASGGERNEGRLLVPVNGPFLRLLKEGALKGEPGVAKVVLGEFDAQGPIAVLVREFGEKDFPELVSSFLRGGVDREIEGHGNHVSGAGDEDSG